MDILIGIASIIFFVCLLFALAGLLDGSAMTYTPMTYDEEMRWLMEDHGLTWEEAHEYASLPSRW